jgi:hypothetical protein
VALSPSMRPLTLVCSPSWRKHVGAFDIGVQGLLAGVVNPTHTNTSHTAFNGKIKRNTSVPPVISTSLRWGFPEALLQLQAVGEEAFAGNRSRPFQEVACDAEMS